MNRLQRESNRRNAARLNYIMREKVTCTNCGEKGQHWIQAEYLTLEMGFWTCPKYYDRTTGKRKNEYL